MTTLDHKHCVFCGKSSDDSTSGGTTCYSQLNCLSPDAVGNKHHAYPTDIKEQARRAAERARNSDPSEIEFISGD